MPTSPPSSQCRLCLKVAPLQLSHIVPAFVFRWLKERSATRGLATIDNYRYRRVEDGWKRRWLCADCEDRLARLEKAFAERTFPSVVAEEFGPYSHGPWLAPFVASVVWRSVTFHMEHPDARQLNSKQRQLIQAALEHWRRFILGEVAMPEPYELHFVPMGTIVDYEDVALPPNFNRYTLASVDHSIRVLPGGPMFGFVKIGPAAMLGLVKPWNGWEGTKVAVGSGAVGGRLEIPADFVDHLIESAERLVKTAALRSEKQTERATRRLFADVDRTLSSGTIRAVQAEVDLFGIERVFPGRGGKHLGPAG